RSSAWRSSRRGMAGADRYTICMLSYIMADGNARLELTLRGSKMQALKLIVTALACAALVPLASAQQPTVRIGVVQPLTGPVAYDGNIYVNTVKMLVDDMNAKGGVLGRKI